MVKHCVRALVVASLLATPVAALAAEPFDSLHGLRYAIAKNYPVDAILFGTDRGMVADVPFMFCVARRGEETVVLDAGFVNQAYAQEWGVVDYSEFRGLLAEVGVRPEDVSLVTLSHLHWDHAGGTSVFPNAKFVIQRRELEYAAGGMVLNKHARLGFYAQDVLDLQSGHFCFERYDARPKFSDITTLHFQPSFSFVVRRWPRRPVQHSKRRNLGRPANLSRRQELREPVRPREEVLGPPLRPRNRKPRDQRRRPSRPG